ncbi:MAG TPA: hypothetical protein DGM69_04730 [Chloroflexi bacterium]|nr:hypothetical protein [Chloroflexota bacterium]
MKILLVGSQEYPMYASAWTRGLNELGHQVAVLDWTKFLSSGLLGKIEKRFIVGPGVNRIRHEILHAAYDVNPDIVLIYATPFVNKEMVCQLTRDFWVTGYHNDDPFGQYGSLPSLREWRKVIPYFNSHHVFREKNIFDYERCGAKLVKVLHHFYLPWMHKPAMFRPGELENYQNDIVFVGHAESDSRIGYLEALSNGNFNVQIYGGTKYWRRHLSFRSRRSFGLIYPVYGEDYVKVISGAKICLAFFSTANNDDYTTRVFEIPAIGSLLMCERTELMQSLYTEDKEAVMFASPEELLDKCRWYLDHKEVRDQIAAAGQARCIASGYDVRNRMHKWENDLRFWSNLKM